MKNKEADTELESRLLEILVAPRCRIEDIRRELPNAAKTISKTRWMRSLRTAG